MSISKSFLIVFFMFLAVVSKAQNESYSKESFAKAYVKVIKEKDYEGFQELILPFKAFKKSFDTKNKSKQEVKDELEEMEYLYKKYQTNALNEFFKIAKSDQIDWNVTEIKGIRPVRQPHQNAKKGLVKYDVMVALHDEVRVHQLMIYSCFQFEGVWWTLGNQVELFEGNGKGIIASYTEKNVKPKVAQAIDDQVDKGKKEIVQDEVELNIETERQVSELALSTIESIDDKQPEENTNSKSEEEIQLTDSEKNAVKETLEVATRETIENKELELEEVEAKAKVDYAKNTQNLQESNELVLTQEKGNESHHNHEPKTMRFNDKYVNIVRTAKNLSATETEITISIDGLSANYDGTSISIIDQMSGGVSLVKDEHYEVEQVNATDMQIQFMTYKKWDKELILKYKVRHEKGQTIKIFGSLMYHPSGVMSLLTIDSVFRF
ncbi:hypothetical protein [Aureibacter tunicatorum]|uniref:Uncharacterized protein n=1 Tax=Aureibacter tunicatorum TaxID=866807 RepID=A0AAE3XPR2_9BACT|nr:hypothetical protein [Aureibacter tunicatorum]MDR6239789.1 hypothetical protein [Aureibacter tunicatorum]BDD04264.1 hypothetical protein AUTU_17470 [Aureibacter tunicatorum]